MTEENDVPWTVEERVALDRLDREMSPPPDAEKRIVAALTRRGVLRKRRGILRGPWPWLLAAAAAAAFFAAGLTLGGRHVRPGPQDGRRTAENSPRFVLFLFDEGEPGGGDRVAEYRAWARSLASARFVAGEKLKPGGRWLTRSAAAAAATEDTSPSRELGGYFVIEAPDLDGALAVARTCPHLRHGGRILVRPIEL